MKHKNEVVKITKDNSGEKIDSPKWHLSVVKAGANMALCTGEFYGYGESACLYTTKQGKVTCPDCIEFIKHIKSITL